MRKFIIPAIGIFSLCTLLCLLPAFLHAQKKEKAIPNDPAYYERFPEKILIRVLLSQKFTHFTIPSGGTADDIKYHANTNLGLGFGFA